MNGPKQNVDKLQTITNAWETLRPDKSFAGFTLAQFKNKLKASFDTRTQIDTLNTQLLAASEQRDDADTASLQAAQLVVNAVRGDPDEGEDGELYEAMGYVRKSARRSGLTRNRKSSKPVAAS